MIIGWFPLRFNGVYSNSDLTFVLLVGWLVPLRRRMSGGEKEAMAEVKEWLAKTFEGAGKSVPEFEYTPRSVKHLNHLMTLSKAKDEAARLVARDFRLKSSEYRSQG